MQPADSLDAVLGVLEGTLDDRRFAAAVKTLTKGRRIGLSAAACGALLDELERRVAADDDDCLMRAAKDLTHAATDNGYAALAKRSINIWAGAR